MALVSSIEPSDKSKFLVHKPTRCLFSIVRLQDGKQYVQLDTYGSNEREFPEKISQSIQFDRTGAAQLLRLFRQTFPDLD